jgi:proteasome lid subunit RPN8/RPN11
VPEDPQAGEYPERVTATVIEHIVARAREAAPEECCGVLIGSRAGVTEAVATRNIAETPTTRFLIDPKGHLDALRDARRRGLDVVGFYHSHPRSAALPSPTDLAEASYPGHLFLVVGLGGLGGLGGLNGLGPPAPDLRLYRFTDGAFVRVPFVCDKGAESSEVG